MALSKSGILALVFIGTFALQHANAQTAVFTHRPVAAGLQRTQDNAAAVSLTFQVAMMGESGEFNIGTSFRTTLRETILAADQGTASKLEAVFDTFKLEMSEDMGMPGLDSKPVTGRIYIVTRGEPLTVTSPDGAISKGEEQFLSAQYAGTDFSASLAEILAGRSVKVGDSISVEKNLIPTLLSIANAAGNASSKSSMMLYLRDIGLVDGVPCAVFAFRMQSMTDMGQIAVEANMNGTLVVQTESCRPVSVVYGGPLDVAAMDGGNAITGNGKMQGSMKFKYP